MASKKKQDWFIAGIQLLTQVGPQGLTIDALCRQLEVTKGSFYHHFSGYEDFHSSLLAFYEQEGTLDIINQLVDVPTPQGKLLGLLDIVVKASTSEVMDPEKAIRAWALQDETVREVQARVDERRLNYVQGLCYEITGDAHRAKIMAQLLYTSLIGSEQIQPPLRGGDLRTLFDEFLKIYNIRSD